MTLWLTIGLTLMRLKQKTSSSGFSLIELLVVIGIIGILAALLLPVISESKRKAQQIQCVNNLHQMGIGLQQFLANNHGYPSAFANSNSDYPGTWLGQLMRGGFEVSKAGTNYFKTGVWRCPSANWSARVPTGFATFYGYNGYGSPRIGDKTNALGLLGHFNPPSHTFVPIAESEVAAPSAMMAMGDSFAGGVFFTHSRLADMERYGNTLTRHQGKANVVFCDGHVESPTLPFLFEDTSDAALSRWNRDHLPHRERLTP